MANRTIQGAKSYHGTNPQNLLETILRNMTFFLISMNSLLMSQYITEKLKLEVYLLYFQLLV